VAPPHVGFWPIAWKSDEAGADTQAGNEPNTAADERFRHFRVALTGATSSGTHYLVVSGLELFGDLYEPRAFVPEPGGTPVKDETV
jgi:hypothetical protein